MSSCFMRLTPMLLVLGISGCISIPPGGSGNNGTIATAVDAYTFDVATLAFHKVVVDSGDDDNDGWFTLTEGDILNDNTIAFSPGVDSMNKNRKLKIHVNDHR